MAEQTKPRFAFEATDVAKDAFNARAGRHEGKDIKKLLIKVLGRKNVKKFLSQNEPIFRYNSFAEIDFTLNKPSLDKGTTPFHERKSVKVGTLYKIG